MSRYERNVDGAKKALEAYAKASRQTSQTGFADWETSVKPLLTGEALRVLTEFYTQMESNGLSATGATRYEDIEVTNYDFGFPAGHEKITFTTCLDVSSVKIYKGKTPQPQASTFMPRFVMEYVVDHQGSDGAWLISSEKSLEKKC